MVTVAIAGGAESASAGPSTYADGEALRTESSCWTSMTSLMLFEGVSLAWLGAFVRCWLPLGAGMSPEETEFMVALQEKTNGTVE